MPVFRLTRRLAFPVPELAEPDGLLAVGGDLSAERLLLAYRNGIFPWYEEGQPLLWWSPDPRLVLFPERLRVSHSMRQVINAGRFTSTINRDFRAVVTACGSVPRPGQRGTWITPGMLKAYCRLHEAGHAHSVETWREGQLAGGLYGVAVGRCFCGESMFARESNASKFALVALVRHLRERGFDLIDCQIPTPHLLSLGAEEMPRAEFLQRLRAGLKPE